MKRKAKRMAEVTDMQQGRLNATQKEVLRAFTSLDEIISQMTGLSVKQSVLIADAFGKCARAVDKCLQIQTGFGPVATQDAPVEGSTSTNGFHDVTSEIAPETLEAAGITKPEPTVQ